MSWQIRLIGAIPVWPAQRVLGLRAQRRAVVTGRGRPAGRWVRLNASAPLLGVLALTLAACGEVATLPISAGTGVPSAYRITLLRDVDGDGVADLRSVLQEGLKSPFGVALDQQGALLVADDVGNVV